MCFEKIIKDNGWVVLFFILLTIFRLSLITKGHRFDLDEQRYLNALYFWIECSQGHFTQSLAYFFNASARPGFVLISLIPAGVQLLLVHFKIISFSNLHFYDIPSFFNVLVTLINSILFFRILMLLVSDRMIALAGTMAYSLLVNTNLYIRHLFPYDYSLCLFFIVLWAILNDAKNNHLSVHTAVLGGILSALGSSVYPGYFADAFIMAVFFVICVRSNFLLSALYVFCFLATITGFELVSNAMGVSYLKQLCRLSTTVTHGSFSEGFLFIVRYIKDVEGLAGILLFVLFIFYCIYMIFKDSSVFKWLVALAVLMFSFNAVMGVVFHKIVFYGRILHMYFPFLVMAGAKAISLISDRQWRRFFTAALILFSIFSFVPFAYTYSKLTYPGDIFFKYLTHIPLNKIVWVFPQNRLDPDIDKHYSAVLLNFESYDNIGNKPLSFPSNMTLVLSQDHPLNFPAYAFEDYSSQERELIKRNHYQMQFYLASRVAPDFDKGINPDQGSLYTAFNPKLPFIYSRRWTVEYTGPA